MARRETDSARQPTQFPFSAQAPPQPSSHIKSENSPIYIISRSVQSVKRFFSGRGKDINVEGSPPKKRRHQRKPASAYTNAGRNPARMSEDDFYLSPYRSRRNGIVFEDITLLAHNIPMRSKSLPSRKTTISLADIDFSKPPPDWFNEAFPSTNSRQPPLRPGNMPIPPPVPPPMKSPVTIIPFVSYEDFRGLQDTITNSLASFPSQPGLLQEMLLDHMFQSLSSLLGSAERGLKRSWGKSKRLRLPAHFIDAINFVTLSCKSVAKAVSSLPPQPGEVSEMCEYFQHIMAIVVQSGNIVDALDVLNLITNDARLKYATRFKRTTEVLISASINFPIDAESTLLSIAQSLPSPIATVLLPIRFMAYEALINFHLQMGMDFIESDSIVFKSTLDKVGHLSPTLKRIIKQFDRLSAEDKAETAVCRQVLKTVEVKLDILKTFHQAIAATPCSKTSFDLLKLASDLAMTAKEPRVQAECLFRMALILVNNQSFKIQNVTPNVLLISARSLNSSAAFHTKVNKLLTSIRQETMTALFAIAHNAFAEHELRPFREGVKLFVELLLKRHPVGGLDSTTILLEGDFVKGLFKIVRIFHPDKNAIKDEDARWNCEEVTKVDIKKEIALTVDPEQDD